MLEISALRGGYGALEVLRGIDLSLQPGEIVALLGSNGAGKSTLNNTVCGLFPAFSGRISFDGTDITRAKQTAIVAAGLIQVPEGEEPVAAARRHAFGRRAADARHRPRPDGRAAPADPG